MYFDVETDGNSETGSILTYSVNRYYTAFIFGTVGIPKN